MDIKKILEEFREWLAKQEITDVEIAENAGEDGDITDEKTASKKC